MVPINSLEAVKLSVIEDILDDVRSNHLVRGFAGCGKTIVLTHVLEWRLDDSDPAEPASPRASATGCT